MSLDRIHDVNGLMQFSAQPVIGTTGTASTIASNQYPGGYQFGIYSGFAAGSNSTNGGAPVVVPVPRGQATTDYQSFSTTGMISHDNAAVVLVSVSTTGIALNLQQAVSHGQELTVMAIPGTTFSLVSTLATTGVGGTTTAACAVIDAAHTFASTQSMIFKALAQRGGTATTNVPYVWRRVI
ncbi:MAG: hypothetical protein BWY21_00359 [Parcubacteria group bacterium ADurb.Bin216]|nr:MAG: hypothetical protein BWY21_00359 [Parcubacteria group bacterium ADurb.Bin216]